MPILDEMKALEQYDVIKIEEDTGFMYLLVESKTPEGLNLKILAHNEQNKGEDIINVVEFIKFEDICVEPKPSEYPQYIMKAKNREEFLERFPEFAL